MPARRRVPELLLTLVALVAVATACAGNTPISVADDDDDDDGQTPATFAAEAYPAIASENCAIAGCHLGPTPQGGLLLPDAAMTLGTAQAYSAITTGGLSGSAVNTANPGNSLILQKGSNEVTHTGGAQWTDNDATYETVLSWIEGGALNN